MIRLCQRCGVEYATDDRRRKFCGAGCYREKSSEQPGPTAFKNGSRPWNQHLRGLRLSPATEFKSGRAPHNRAATGAVRIRTDKNGKRRAWVKVAEPNKWKLRAVVAWEQRNGRLPAGLVVHHEDHDPLNDNPDNLTAITRREHWLKHAAELEAARAAAIFDALGAK